VKRLLPALALLLCASFVRSDITGPTTGTLPTNVLAPSNGQCLVYSGGVWINGSCSGGSSAFSAITSGTNTSAAMVVGAGASLGFSSALGTGTVTNVLALTNTTSASSGNQADSPTLSWCGNGWGTTAPASASVCWQTYVVPVQGGTPLGTLTFAENENGGAFTTVASLTSGGMLTTAALNLNGNVPVTAGFSNLGSQVIGVYANSVNVEKIASTALEPTVPTAALSGATNVAIASGTGACATTSTTTLLSTSGHFTCTGTTGASTITLTFPAITTTYVCPTGARDVTTAAVGNQTGVESTTSVTFSFSSVTANDVIDFNCPGGF
jgi:hypothetical protein